MKKHKRTIKYLTEKKYRKEPIKIFKLEKESITMTNQNKMKSELNKQKENSHIFSSVYAKRNSNSNIQI